MAFDSPQTRSGRACCIVCTARTPARSAPRRSAAAAFYPRSCTLHCCLPWTRSSCMWWSVSWAGTCVGGTVFFCLACTYGLARMECIRPLARHRLGRRSRSSTRISSRRRSSRNLCLDSSVVVPPSPRRPMPESGRAAKVYVSTSQGSCWDEGSYV